MKFLYGKYMSSADVMWLRRLTLPLSWTNCMNSM